MKNSLKLGLAGGLFLYFCLSFLFGLYNVFDRRSSCIENEGWIKGSIFCDNDYRGSFGIDMLSGLFWPIGVAKISGGWDLKSKKIAEKYLNRTIRGNHVDAYALLDPNKKGSTSLKEYLSIMGGEGFYEDIPGSEYVLDSMSVEKIDGSESGDSALYSGTIKRPARAYIAQSLLKAELMLQKDSSEQDVESFMRGRFVSDAVPEWNRQSFEIELARYGSDWFISSSKTR